MQTSMKEDCCVFVIEIKILYHSDGYFETGIEGQPVCVGNLWNHLIKHIYIAVVTIFVLKVLKGEKRE